MAVESYTKTGNRASSAPKLDKSVFGVEADSHQLLKEVYLAHLANARDNIAVTKKRGEVRGGGRKPWRQKGTGRARFGSSRNPIWTGGGVAFGPTGLENYGRRLNTKAKRQALRQALSLAADEGRIKIIDSFDTSAGRVKPVLNLLKKIKAEGKVLLVVDQKDNLAVRSIRNLPNVKLVQANYLTSYDVLSADTIVITKKSLELITNRLSAKDSKPSAKATVGRVS